MGKLVRTHKSFALSLAVMLAASPLAAATTVDGKAGGSANTVAASTLDEGLRLNTAITVETGVVTLGDVFQGYLSRPEKVIAQAPKPGQRLTLTAEFLADIARTYGLDWKPANGYDRAVVYQPGQTISPADIMDAVKTTLTAHGMPANYGVAAATPLYAVTVATTASKEVGVREAQYAADSKTFSALVQIPPNDPQAVFIQVRGTTFATVQVPVLKQAAGKNTTITADMIDMVALPEDQMRATTLTDPNEMIGKTPKLFLRAGQPVRDSELVKITFTEIPVFVTGIDRNKRITADDIKMLTVNADTVPADAATAPEFLIGKTPRRLLAANVPVRRSDVALVHEIEVPVVTRDIMRGTTITEADITFKSINEAQVIGEVIMDQDEIIGQIARLGLREGQPIRRNTVGKAQLVQRGQSVTVLWSAKAMSLTAQGKAMEKGGAGDVIRVTNTKSNQTVLAEIIDSRTVRIAAPDQTSSR